MKTIKYILSCVGGFLDAWVGKGTNGGIKEAIVGFSAMLVVILLFFASLFFLDRKTNLNYKTVILFAIGITILTVCIVFAIMAFIEKLHINN